MLNKQRWMVACLTLIVLLGWPRMVCAAEVMWQIHWLADGTLQEEVQVQGLEITNPDSSWNVSQEGDLYILRREAKGWASYLSLPDRLPLQVTARNYLIGQQTEINIGSPSSGTLWEQLKAPAGFHLSLSVPGFIRSSSAQRVEESQASWDFTDAAAFMQAGRLAQVITIDGFLLGIVIVLLGMLWIGFKFMKQMKKAKKIIAEEYALPTDRLGHRDQAGPKSPV
jgi:hypothetical protein